MTVQANPDADPADVRYTVNTLMAFYSHVLTANEALAARITPAESEYVRHNAFLLREGFLQIVLKLNYRCGV